MYNDLVPVCLFGAFCVSYFIYSWFQPDRDIQWNANKVQLIWLFYLYFLINTFLSYTNH